MRTIKQAKKQQRMLIACATLACTIGLVIIIAIYMDGRQLSQHTNAKDTSHHLRARDGDSLVTQDDKQMRLLCIDAPEYGQPGGLAARDALKSLINGKVTIRTRGTDKYKRALVIAFIHKDNEQMTVNVEMVRQGHAWVYRYYADTCGILRQELCAAEQEARDARRGLWGGTRPVPPWRWRKGKIRPPKRFPACKK